jgi:integrase
VRTHYVERCPGASGPPQGRSIRHKVTGEAGAGGARPRSGASPRASFNCTTNSPVSTGRTARFGARCRRDEILTLLWSFVDFERSCLRLPDSKTGAKVVRLGAPAIDLLSGLPRFANPFVFPAARGANTWSDRKNRIGAGHFVGIEGIWQRVRGWAGLEDRATARSVAHVRQLVCHGRRHAAHDGRLALTSAGRHDDALRAPRR